MFFVHADRQSPAACRPGKRSALAWLAALAATLAVLTGLFLLMVFNDFFHDYEHQRLGIEVQPVEFSTGQFVDELQAYFVSRDASLIQHPYLSYRERLHYLEVKQLMRIVLDSFLVSSAASAGLLGWMLFRARWRREPLREVFRRVLRNLAGILLVTIAAGALSALDFDRSFVKLHGLLFESNNWILPPHTLTVHLFPVQYFSDFFLVYCGLVIATGIVILGSLAVVRPRLKTDLATAGPLSSMGPVLSIEAVRGLSQPWLKGSRAETTLKRLWAPHAQAPAVHEGGWRMSSRANWLTRCLLPDWACNCEPDETHFYRRCFTRRYRAKRRVVRDLWLGSGCVMLLYPVLPLMLTLGLATTLLSFVILDETD